MSEDINVGSHGGPVATTTRRKALLPARPMDTYCDTVGGSHMLHMKTWGIVIRHSGSSQ